MDTYRRMAELVMEKLMENGAVFVEYSAEYEKVSRRNETVATVVHRPPNRESYLVIDCGPLAKSRSRPPEGVLHCYFKKRG